MSRGHLGRVTRDTLRIEREKERKLRAKVEREIAAERAALDGAARALVEQGLVVWSEDSGRRPVLIVRGQTELAPDRHRGDGAGSGSC